MPSDVKRVLKCYSGGAPVYTLGFYSRPEKSAIPECLAIQMAEIVRARKDFIKYDREHLEENQAIEFTNYYEHWLFYLGMTSQQYLLLKEVAIGVENVGI